MRSDWQPTPAGGKRTAQLFRYRGYSPSEVASRQAGDGLDLSGVVNQLRHTATDARATLSWQAELSGDDAPQADDVLEIRMDGRPLWIGIVAQATGYNEARGTRSMTVTAQSRDSQPLWRDVRRVTSIYPAGSDLSAIAREVAVQQLGLAPADYDLPATGQVTRFSDVQMADMTAWEILRTLYQPLLREPLVDALGRLKTISRDITRSADIEIPRERLKSIARSSSGSRPTRVQVKYLDPALTAVSQQDQVLGNATITSGFFQLTQAQRIYWSKDKRQRARDTYLVVKQSCNGGLLPVGDESYRETDAFSGEITVDTEAWVPALATGSIAAMLAASAIPDIAPPFGGPTIPTGKIVHGSAEAALLVTMMSMGTGVYEIHGVPYDYQHAKHTIEAFDDAAPEWRDQSVEIDNDLIGTRAKAEALAVGELRYQAAATSSHTLSIIDDPRIEPGDMLGLPGGARFYVTGYSRELMRPSGGELQVTGFQV